MNGDRVEYVLETGCDGMNHRLPSGECGLKQVAQKHVPHGTCPKQRDWDEPLPTV